jgi:hypothetical protein
MLVEQHGLEIDVFNICALLTQRSGVAPPAWQQLMRMSGLLLNCYGLERQTKELLETLTMLVQKKSPDAYNVS